MNLTRQKVSEQAKNTYYSVEDLTFTSNEHEIHFFGSLSTNKKDYNEGDIYRGKWDKIPDELFIALELEKITPLRDYVLIYKPEGECKKQYYE